MLGFYFRNVHSFQSSWIVFDIGLSSIHWLSQRVHGWPWIPWCNTIRKVPMHGGCSPGAPWKWTDCSGFWGLDSATRVCFFGFFGWSIGVFFEWKNLMIFLGGNGMIGATNCRVEPHHAVKNQFLIPGALAADAFQHGNWGKYQYTFMNSALRHFWAAFFVLEHEHVSYVVKNPLGLGRLHGGLRFRFLGKDKNTTLELRSASGLRKLEWFTSGYCRPATLGRYQSDDLNFHVFDIFLQIVVIVIYI